MDWSNQPSEQRQSLSGLRRRGYTPITASDYATQDAALQDDIRGLKLSQTRVEKDIQLEKLEQKNIQLGTEKEVTKQTKEKFTQATYKSVLERTKTAKTLDETTLATKSWKPDQERMKTTLESLQLNLNNDKEKLSMDRRAAVAQFN